MRRPAPARAQRGFTLLEILIVLAIIGVIVTFAALSLGSRAIDDQLETEATRLQQLLAIAVEDAEVQGLDLGWRFTAEGYEFLVLTPSGEWQPLPSGSSLRRRNLPDALYLDLNLEGQAIPPASPANKTPEPQVLLLSSGEVSPFRLDVRAHGYKPYIRLQGDALGRMKRTRMDG